MMRRSTIYLILLGFTLAMILPESIYQYRTLLASIGVVGVMVAVVDAYLVQRQARMRTFLSIVEKYATSHDVEFASTESQTA